jgi:hypothetical protein
LKQLEQHYWSSAVLGKYKNSKQCESHFLLEHKTVQTAKERKIGEFCDALLVNQLRCDCS